MELQIARLFFFRYPPKSVRKVLIRKRSIPFGRKLIPGVIKYIKAGWSAGNTCIKVLKKNPLSSVTPKRISLISVKEFN